MYIYIYVNCLHYDVVNVLPQLLFPYFLPKTLHNILKDQNAHGKSSIGSICLSLLGQQFHDNHSR